MRRVVIAWALVSATLGIGCKARELDWQFAIDPAIDAEARGIVATLRDDGCDGDGAPVAVYRFARRGGEAYVTPTLPPGEFALAVVALDARCRPVGRGCEVVSLPREDGEVVQVTVRPNVAESAVCEVGASCQEGVCVRDDV